MDDKKINPDETVTDSNGDESGENINKALVLADESLPEDILILPIEERPLFPGMMVPIILSGKLLIDMVKKISDNKFSLAGVVLAKKINQENPFKSKLYKYGTAIRVHRHGPIGENNVQVVVEAIRRFKLVKVLEDDKFLRWNVKYHEDPKSPEGDELKAYIMAIINGVKDLLKLNPMFGEQLKLLMSQISHKSPGKVMDLIASMTTANGPRLQELLETIPLIQRAERLLVLLKEEIEFSKLQEKISRQIEEKISQQQKEFFLHEQLKAIKKELGLEKDDKSAEIDKIEKRLEKLTLSSEAQKVVKEEMDKLSLLDTHSSEYHVTRNYLDWLTGIPWGIFSKDNYDIDRAQKILDRDHYGLKDIKERILEFISVGIKKGNISGSILCFVGPPGVGKTSIGKSIATALNRKFFRFSLGGMRDEAEIKGHRRTYIGAMPGKFVQSLKTVGTANPVIMLDEIDKIGHHFHGDPASALLEVLDPEQNSQFLDHYLDVRFDLSRILFITTANQLDTIPAPLMDRMEILRLSGYILDEKVEIAKKFLLPRQRKEHGLKVENINLSDSGLKYIINRYSREAGVRGLENNLKKILRKVTLQHIRGKKKKTLVNKKSIEKFLGKPIFSEEELYKKDIPGVVLGLAWTNMGGSTLYIECTGIKGGEKGYKQTGQLGDVMKESAEIAYSFIRSQVKKLKIKSDFFENNYIHLHVPAGATPKDGPSAGITMALALYSLALNKAVRRDIAMTGELTITGKVLPIGGVKEKILAAKRVKIYELIFPEENRRDFDELDENLRKGIKVNFVNYFSDVLKAVY
ncbi:endopeptidase La [Candidatus Riflebacteria bacterium]